MAYIKCIGCYQLRRSEVQLKPGPGVVFDCPDHFPYLTFISGLLRPGKGILQAAEACPEQPGQHCILCEKTEVTHYGVLALATCTEHYRAWSKWLDNHPERRNYLKPKGRMRSANWIEVFREFIEDMRRTREG